jgi:hypothetical protein
MPNNIEKLYQNLKADGYQLGSLDEFSKNMSDSTKADKLYQNLSADGYQLGSREDFFGKIRPQAEAKPQSTQQPATQPRQPAKPSGTYKPTWQEQMAFGSTLGGAQYAVENATKGIDQMEQASKQTSPFGSGNVGIGNNQSLRKGKQTFDAEKGTFIDTYLTSDGREFRDLQQANNAQADLDKIADSVRYEESLKAIGIDPSIDLNDPNNLKHMLGDAYAERDAILKKMKDDKEGEQAVSDLIISGGYDPTPNDKVDNRKTYLSALRMLERRINALETARDKRGFWGGTADVLSDPSNYSFGLTDLEDSKQMAKIKEKIDVARANGTKPQLSDSEKALARNYMLNQQAEQLNKDNWWYNAGKGFGQTLSFMKDFALTGGGFASIAKGGLAMGGAIGKKTAAKVLGEYMTKNIGTKALGKAIEYTGKGIGLAAGAEAGGFMLNNTVQAAGNAADVINKQAGNLTVGKDGNLTFEGGKNLGMAVLKSQIERTGQNGSELVGLAFDAMPGIIGKVVQRTTVGKAIKKLTDNALWKKGEGLLNYLGVSSVWGEGMEEEYDMARTEILNRLTNGEYAPEGSGLFDLDRQIDTWKTVGLTSMILRVPSMVVSGTQAANYYANQYNLNASDKNMRSVFGDYGRYESVKSAIDGADNANIAGVLSGLITNAELSNEEKQAMFFYANDLVKVRGFNIGNVVAAVNGYTAPPKVASYQVKADGKSFDELDENGNVLAHHEYETNDEMKAGLYELQQQRFDDNLQSDISIMKTRPKGQFDKLVSDYLMQNVPDMLPSDFEAILNKPSLERTDDEQQLVAPFSELLHNTVYDNTMLHEEQSQQDGEEIADADSIDIEAGSEQGATINAEWQAAQQARNELFSRNEELAQEVLSRENNGLSHQEIISSLTTFRPEDVQAVIDFYNKKARYEGYINRKAQKIDEEAHNSRERHTLNGTINGQADVRNVYTITDGTNEYYLVSGDITTDPATGRITGSTSGLIIGMDLDGSFVQLGDGSGYSLMQPAMTLDQFEEQERIRLQEQVSAIVDPNGTMGQKQAGDEVAAMQQPTEQQAGNVGGEAGANSGTGADETPTPTPANPVQQENPPSPSEEAAGTPAVSIESVTDKDGIKRYENGVGVDDAIADIQADGFDVGEVADASIAEAQQTINKINGKATKTRKDLLDRKKTQDVIDYYKALKDRWAAMLSQGTEEEPANGEENVNNQPEQHASGGNVVPSQAGGENSVAKPRGTVGQPQGTVTVEEQKQERIKALKAELGELFDDDFTKANDVYELVSMWIGRNRNLAWDDVNGKRGLQKELGWTRKIGGDTKFIETLLAKKGEGVGVDEFVHMVWESPENSINGEKRFDTDEIKNALLDLLKSAQSKSDVVDYAVNTREQSARAVLEAQQQMEQEAAAQQPAEVEVENLTAEQIADMEANLPFAAPVEGEDIPDSPITQLMKLVQELMQQEGMPQIKLVDTDRMSDDEWYDIASAMYEGAFVSQEEIDFVRNSVLSEGLYIIEDSGAITVYSDSQTPEEVKYKIEYIKEQNNGRSNEEEAGELEAEDVQRPAEGMPAVQSTETPEAAGADGTEGQGSTEPIREHDTSERDEYLKPRNEKEEQIIADVMAQLQQEIDAAIKVRDKAANDLQKAQVKESDRATDAFSDDDAFQKPDQLFSFDEMGGTDRSQEGVNRRTEAERKAFEDAKKKVDQSQSEAERNRRIRGAFDNERRQTSFTPEGEASGMTDDPMEAIEQAAHQFKQEQEAKNAYGKDNKLVSQDRYEELKKRMKQKLLGQLNAGFDPEIISIGAEMAMFHVEAGARKFADYARRMIDDLGDAIRPYLQGIYESAKRMPGMQELRKEMDSTEVVDAFDVDNFDKEKPNNANEGDNSVNVNKQDDNELEKDVTLQPEGTQEYFVTAVSNALQEAVNTGEKPFKSINDLRKLASDSGMNIESDGRSDILLQELVELALVRAARNVLDTKHHGGFTKAAYKDIVKLYKMQPTIAQRSSNRIQMQQYSTPLPMSFVAQMFANTDGNVLEPTAGNGMLVFGIEPQKVTVNELDKTRLANLQQQGFGAVTNQDATQPFEGDEQYDTILANPPFGSAEAKEYDGKMIPGLEEQITLNALSKMKDNGRAAIIIGGNMKYADNGAINSQKAFFTYLYDHYNVKGVIDMDGSLYARQGTTYPTRLILIDGRRSEEEMAQTKVYPPVKDNTPRKAETFSDLFDIVEEINNDNRKTNGNEVLRTSGPVVEPNRSDAQRKTNTQRRAGQSDANGSDGQPENTRRTGGSTAVRGNEPGGIQQPSGVVSGQNGTGGLSDVSQQPSTPSRGGIETDNGGGSHVGGSGRVQPTGSGTVQTDGRRDKGVKPDGEPSGTVANAEEKRELGSEKLPYRPHNGAFSLESVAPAAMVEAMDKTLTKIEKEYGNIDDFVTNELGYDTVEDMHNALAAEQVDSVAMAIWNMKNGEGMVIGDQTGVGKGRQMAALIRWAVRQGKKPIFVTKDADLFSDIYRDLVDIGSGELRPFIFNADVTITDANGRVVHKSLSPTTQKKVLAMNELPDGFDFAILSYPQMNTGDAISQEEAGKNAKENGERAKKGKAVKAGKPTPKADFLRRISKDNYLLMDESQNAAGSGNTGAYFQSILKDARAVTFASATFAKSPDTMPLYAIRTAISKAKVKAQDLISMIGKGGVTLQEIMSRAMTGAGQMVRRERDMSDVVTDWKTIDDTETAQKARRDYDNVMQAFNAIIDFQNDWIRPALARKSAEFAGMAGTVTERRGTKNAGVDNPPFVNRLYNFSKQLLLSLKVDAVVNEVVKEIEAGHKPVIALENTLESALDEYGVGETIDDPTLFGKLKKGLDATFRYTLKDEDGNEMGGELQPHELGPEGEQAYNDLVEMIQESTQGMFISPLDAITEKLEQKGVKVGEISGRKTRAVMNDNGEYEVRKRENTDRKKLARDFNSGALDCLIINKTGSTGISLHASKRFTDQRPRTMIMAQPLSDINDYMQMIGRIDRTGQSHRGYYINLGLPVPAETRFMMMLANKLKSLNANTTTSQENKDNDVDAPDLLNKYGDQVMIEYLRDNPDVYRKLGEFLKGKSEPGAQTVKAEQLDEYKAKEGDARQITGRVALLSVDEQDAFYDDVTRRYNELIKYLNDTGSNDLKITVMPLKARTIAKGVSSEGTAPNSGNPFADNAYVEWVEMDILKKPMKAAEVGKTIDQLNPEVQAGKPLGAVAGARTRAQEKSMDGRLTPRIRQIIDTVERETKEKFRKEDERYEAAKQRAEQDIAERTEAINKQEKRTKEQKEEAIKKYADEKRQAIEESHNNMVNKIEANRMRLEKALTMFTVGDSVLVPDDLTTDTFLGSVNGVFCGFKAKNENVTQSTTLAVFCTLDGRRKIEVKVSDTSALARIDRMTQENWDAAHQVTLSNWDEQIPTSSRKRGYIMTGNILQAIADSKQGESFVGQLVTFTDENGNVRDGILMPDKWEPSQLKGATVPIAARREEIKTVESKKPIISADGRVTLTHYGLHNQWGYYTIEVPKSKKQGGEFYLDKQLLDLVDGGDFFTASGRMRGRVPEANIDAVIDRLGQMGVTLPSDSKVELEVVESKKEDGPKRMITTEDPIEAIRQAADDWRKENVKSSVSRKSSEIADMLSELPKRFGLQGVAPTYTINSRDDLEALKGHVSRTAYNEIEELYNERDTGAAFVPRARMVVVFCEHLEDTKEAETAWWHEQTHGFWQSLPISLRRRYGEACLEYLRNRHKDIYNHIRREYPMSEWPEEACSFLIGNVVIEREGTERFLNDVFVGNEEIVNFATELRNYIKNGQQKGKGDDRSHQLRQTAGIQGRTEVYRTDSQGREWENSELRAEAESELSEDPIEAIEQSAKRWRIQRRDQENGSNTPESHSEKAVYDERLNRVETVFTEAYQDSMIALKTAQNAIAHDKAIPDSQNAYMAENLMHGKNKNEQDLFNKMLRDPLINTINKIMNTTGMNWGDIDRYVYTKSGLERNREFFVRDWLAAQRGKTTLHSYEDLNAVEKDIYDRKAETIETLFEDGDIETEEQKEKELAKALQEAHDEYLSDVEEGWQRAKRDGFDRLNETNGANGYSFADYLADLNHYIESNIDAEYNPSEYDYSGFRAMYGDEEGKYDEDAIVEELMNTEDAINETAVIQPYTEQLWEQIRNCTRYGLERYREAGMRSDEQIDRVEQMFHWYVPMRGFKEDRGEDMYQYFTGKDKAKNYVGGLLKHAKGRGSEANYPISTIFAMTYKAISDCNQNLVNQKLYRLCQANPNDLVVLSDSWARLNEQTGEWEEVAPEIGDDMDEEEIRDATLAFEEEMRQLAIENKAQKIKGKEHFDYKPMDKKKKSEHIVDVRINGQQKRMIVVGNPRMAQALNGQLRFEHGRNVFSKWNATIKNFMASVFTSYSPTFALRNMFRDWTHFRTMLVVREGYGYASRANKYYRQSLFKMVGLFKKYRDGRLDESIEMERDFKDFMDNGGITGFVFMQKLDDIQKDMENIYKKQKAGKPIRLNNNLWEKILGAVEALNEGIENNARFATYRASRHYAGRTKARSAYDAKEITVNFNRKGAGSKTAGFKSHPAGKTSGHTVVEDAAKVFGVTSQVLGEGRIFFNATVQAIATTFKNFQNADGSLNKGYIAKWAGKYALPPFMFGLALPLINKALAAAFGGDGDDDPYANLPEWTRRRNLCFYIGHGNFITIPIGQELAAFLTLGDIAAGNTYAPDLKPVDKSWDDEIVGVMNTFSPVDISTKITKGGLMEDPISEVTGRTFSVLAPLVAVEQNLAWTGRPIYREDRFGNDQYTPEYQMVYSGTNPVLVNATKLLHELGGGDDIVRGKFEVNPAIIQYLWEQYTGGPGKVFSNTISIGKDAKDVLSGNESDFNIRKVEGLKAFVQQGDDRTEYYRANAKYRKYKADAERMYDAVKGYEGGAAENPEYVLKLEQISKGEDFVRMQIVREADKQLSQINKAANKAEGAERKELRRLYNEQVKAVVDMLDEVGE